MAGNQARIAGRTDLFLPGHRAAPFHNAAEMVGRKAICRDLSIGQRLARPNAAGVYLSLYYYVTLSSWHEVGRPGRWLYDRFQRVWGGPPFPRREGQIPVGQPTPRCDLGLKTGDLVRVKPYQEILATLDTSCTNRGLGFNSELVPYCGKVYRVKTRVEKFIDEKTGKMQHLRTPAVILVGVYCKSLYCGQRMFCPRSIYSWWREIWLERVPEAPAAQEVTGEERLVA